MKLEILLLAAGQSTRMGGPNKLLHPFSGEKSVLETTLSRLSEAALGPITVVTGHDRAAILPIIERFSGREIFNENYALGLTSSIQKGIATASGAAAGFMICLADMPLILPTDYRFLNDFFLEKWATDEQAIALPVFEKRRGNPVVFARFYREKLLNHAEPEGCRGLVQAHSDHVFWLKMRSAAVLNDFDTPADFERLNG